MVPEVPAVGAEVISPAHLPNAPFPTLSITCLPDSGGTPDPSMQKVTLSLSFEVFISFIAGLGDFAAWLSRRASLKTFAMAGIFISSPWSGRAREESEVIVWMSETLGES